VEFFGKTLWRRYLFAWHSGGSALRLSAHFKDEADGMPRHPHLHASGACYHVILRGNHREDIFSIPQDRLVPNDIVAARFGASATFVYFYAIARGITYALMGIVLQLDLRGAIQTLVFGCEQCIDRTDCMYTYDDLGH
jgi:hypothetical protein